MTPEKHATQDEGPSADLFERFHRTFGCVPEVTAQAPGRINLIGDHTDYMGGLVLPIAIDRTTRVAAARTARGRFRVNSSHFREVAAWKAPDRSGATDEDRRAAAEGLPHWARYVFGVVEVLREHDAGPDGADLLIDSDVPPGAGLGSSAALEVAVATTLLALAGHEAAPLDVARWCQQAENIYAGSPCGLMDQTISACAEEGCALLIDCRTLALRPIPLPLRTARLVVMDCGVRHSIAAGQYAARRKDCEAALATLAAWKPSLTSLRDVSEEDVNVCPSLGAVPRRRALHVVTENARVLAASDAMAKGDIAAFGRLMLLSHASLRDAFEVSCAELDRLVAVAMRVPGVLGARMTGGGFGGCVIALIREEAVEALRIAVTEATPEAPPAAVSFLSVRASGPAGVIRP